MMYSSPYISTRARVGGDAAAPFSSTATPPIPLCFIIVMIVADLFVPAPGFTSRASAPDRHPHLRLQSLLHLLDEAVHFIVRHRPVFGAEIQRVGQAAIPLGNLGPLVHVEQGDGSEGRPRSAADYLLHRGRP